MTSKLSNFKMPLPSQLYAFKNLERLKGVCLYYLDLSIFTKIVEKNQRGYNLLTLDITIIIGYYLQIL